MVPSATSSVHRQPTAIDLFSGAGGLSCGARMAGVSVLQAIEKDCHAAATYYHNHPEVDSVLADISALDPLDCLSRIQAYSGSIDMVLAGFPCQGFSESNRRTRTLDNPKNSLYREVLRFVADVRPRFFVMENVAGLQTLARGRILGDLVTSAQELGYTVESQVLCAADFGVPQIRRRIFIVGSRLPQQVRFPAPTHGPGRTRPYVTVHDAIGDLPVLKNGSRCDYHLYRAHRQLTDYQRLMRGRRTRPVQGNIVSANNSTILRRYAHISPGENWEAIPDRLLANYSDQSRCHSGIYYRLRSDRPSKVLGNFRKNMLIHPTQDRGLSVREAARLQSFPDSYEFVGSIGFQQQQVADAVPPLLAAAVVRQMVRVFGD